MSTDTSNPINRLAAGIAARRALPRPVRGAELVDKIVAARAGRAAGDLDLIPGRRELPLAAFAAEGAELVAAGLVARHGGVLRPVDEEVEQALAASLLLGDLRAGIGRYGRDAELGLAIAWAAGRALREGGSTDAAQGDALDAILGWLPATLPHEEELHLAALLRIEVLASAPGLPLARAREAAAAATALLLPAAPDPVLQRAGAALLDLAHGAEAVLVDELLDAAVGRLLAAARSAQGALSSPPPVDALIDKVLGGGDAEELVEDLAAPFQRFALQQAYLVGALLCRRPQRWAAIETELLAGAEATFPILPALFDGVGDALPACPQPVDSPIAGALVAAAASAATLLRQSALAALALAPDADERARYLVGAIGREPVAAIRAAVAVALGRAPASTEAALLRLCDDPEPAVRAAASFSAAGRGLAGDALLGAIRADLELGSAAVSPAAAAAAACLGVVDASLGERLLAPLLAAAEPEEPEWQAAGRFATPRFAFALWASAPEHAQHLYGSAVGDNDWLTALGRVLHGDLALVPPPDPALGEELRARALSRLGAETEVERIAAAAALARLAPPTAELFDVLLRGEAPSIELLQILVQLAPRSRERKDRWVAPLLEVLADDVAPPEARTAAAICLGHLAPAEHAEARALLTERISADDAAYTALARLIACG